MCCHGKCRYAVALLGSVVFSATIWHFSSVATRAEETPQTNVEGQTQPAVKDKDSVARRQLRHVVLFQFKDTSSPSEVENIVNEFRELPEKISAVAKFEFGTNNSPEGLNEGLTHCFLLTFRTEEDRDIYLKHPAHEAFVGIVKDHLEKAVVVDYWTGE